MSKLAYYKGAIEETLRHLIKPFQPELLHSAMTYYLFQEGKRIRPLIVCSVCEALGGELKPALILGCAVEIVHNYSLVHDDLPCMDNDTLRRGKPTCHVVFGEDVALLAGDGLLTLAFEILSDPDYLEGLSHAERIMAVNVLAKKAGPLGMVGGQVMDIRKLSSPEEINLKKTAELFSASFMLGGICAHRTDMLKELEAVGRDFGLFFQMVDDYKDKDGVYTLMGESLRDDIERKKKALVEDLRALVIYTPTMEEILNTVCESM